MIRVVLPAHLRTFARVDGEVTLDVAGPVTEGTVLDALEARYPMLRGTIRDHVTRQRRPFIRFFACEQDLSHELPDTPAAKGSHDRSRADSHRRCDGGWLARAVEFEPVPFDYEIETGTTEGIKGHAKITPLDSRKPGSA